MNNTEAADAAFYKICTPEWYALHGPGFGVKAAFRAGWAARDAQAWRPPEVTDDMVTAYLDANDEYWRMTDEMPLRPDRWRQGTPKEATRASLKAALDKSAPPGEPAPALPQAAPVAPVESRHITSLIHEYVADYEMCGEDEHGRDARYVPNEHERYLILDAMMGFERPPAAPIFALGAPTFSLGDRVRKTKGSSWQGVIVGTYSTTLTPEGYAVESEREPGSVQIYPVTALEKVGSIAPPAAPVLPATPQPELSREGCGSPEALAEVLHRAKWLKQCAYEQGIADEGGSPLRGRHKVFVAEAVEAFETSLRALAAAHSTTPTEQEKP